MKKVESFSQLKRLAKWYRPERYAWVIDASLEQIHEELVFRRSAYWELEKQPQKLEHVAELFSVNYGVNLNSGQEELERMIASKNKRISLISKGDVLLCTQQLKQRNDYDPDPFSNENIKQPIIDGDQNLWLSIPLYLSNHDIISELENSLAELRKAANIKEPINYYVNARIKKIRQGGIFEYLDLDIWARANKVSLDMEAIVRAINEHVFYQPIYACNKEQRSKVCFDAKSISDEFKNRAAEAISINFTEKLELFY